MSPRLYFWARTLCTILLSVSLPLAIYGIWHFLKNSRQPTETTETFEAEGFRIEWAGYRNTTRKNDDYRWHTRENIATTLAGEQKTLAETVGPFQKPPKLLVVESPPSSLTLGWYPDRNEIVVATRNRRELREALFIARLYELNNGKPPAKIVSLGFASGVRGSIREEFIRPLRFEQSPSKTELLTPGKFSETARQAWSCVLIFHARYIEGKDWVTIAKQADTDFPDPKDVGQSTLGYVTICEDSHVTTSSWYTCQDFFTKGFLNELNSTKHGFDNWSQSRNTSKLYHEWKERTFKQNPKGILVLADVPPVAELKRTYFKDNLTQLLLGVGVHELTHYPGPPHDLAVFAEFKTLGEFTIERALEPPSENLWAQCRATGKALAVSLLYQGYTLDDLRDLAIIHRWDKSPPVKKTLDFNRSPLEIIKEWKQVPLP